MGEASSYNGREGGAKGGVTEGAATHVAASAYNVGNNNLWRTLFKNT